MPLHNHPQMYGVNYVLSGYLLQNSYDLMDPSDPESAEFQQLLEDEWHQMSGDAISPHINKSFVCFCLKSAIFKTDKQTNNESTIAKKMSSNILQTNDWSAVLPHKQNLHHFVCLRDSSVLQILLPNYDNDQQRDCTWYEILDTVRSSQQYNDSDHYYGLPHYCYLQQVQEPLHYKSISVSFDGHL
ncbi:hypothetical protein RFI_11491 [Reticulomyxa filosa]|uniref:Uncharacterized protein n=1 Tax=Reticulomyxa filosa TaxID=46433 RepID=X6NIS9_RETFI|nr:hypothetical protein RFI_11491 [Reticulomyxa filosa]|eukprot:ETO25644.1 hypothetical protein RFI_11491 [Reticulomyxa filosa]